MLTSVFLGAPRMDNKTQTLHYRMIAHRNRCMDEKTHSHDLLETVETREDKVENA
ncbi:MAG: hypothetical protein WA125_09405 [Desulfosporosinus sp.]